MAEAAEMPAGLIIAAPATGQGKTTVTLGLLRALRDAGVRVGSFKAGPDYIDAAFHARASGRPCFNLDAWAMRAATRDGALAAASRDAELVIGEGVMGLFDGTGDGAGSTADLAAMLELPVVLVIDVGGMAGSAAAILHGFATLRRDVQIAGVIFNRAGGDGHRRAIARTCESLGPRILGFLPHAPDIALPERHLGLVQAGEHAALDAFIARAASLVAEHIDLAALRALAAPIAVPAAPAPAALPVLGQRIAVADDIAFAFAYPHVLAGWRAAGAEIVPFSPLAGEPPDPAADAVYLPGGYPELHAGRLAGNTRFLEGLRAAAARGATIYGECGGYMALGRALTDADGTAHAMAGLLPVETSFAAPAMAFGYRAVELAESCALGPKGARFRGHEFHYARIVAEADDARLFTCAGAGGQALPAAGSRAGTVLGSFVHLIDGT
jgi:cobyrinic acid a,c-diamide synthase